LRHPRDIYDRPQDASDPDDNWVGGDIEIVEERPATALAGDPRQRKWMAIGVGGCVLLTTLAVLVMTSGSSPVQAEEKRVEALAPVEQGANHDAVGEAAAPVEAQPARDNSPAFEAKPATTATLAATSHASASASPSATPSTPAPSTPPESKPAPAGAPALAPADDAPAANPLSELPDVEPWDEADAAIEQAEPADPGPAAANEPPELGDLSRSHV